jgi:hypothetical protein
MMVGSTLMRLRRFNSFVSVYALFVICVQPKAYMFRIPVSPVSCGFCIATKLHTWCSLSVDLEELEL